MYVGRFLYVTGAPTVVFTIYKPLPFVKEWIYQKRRLGLPCMSPSWNDNDIEEKKSHSVVFVPFVGYDMSDQEWWGIFSNNDFHGQGTNFMYQYLGATTAKEKFNRVGMLSSTGSSVYPTLSAGFSSQTMDQTIYNTLVTTNDDVEVLVLGASVSKGFTVKNSNTSVAATNAYVAVQDGDLVFIKSAASPRQDDFIVFEQKNGFKYTMTTVDNHLYILTYNDNFMSLTDYPSAPRTLSYIATKQGVRINAFQVFNTLAAYNIGFMENYQDGMVLRVYLDSMNITGIPLLSGPLSSVRMAMNARGELQMYFKDITNALKCTSYTFNKYNYTYVSSTTVSLADKVGFMSNVNVVADDMQMFFSIGPQVYRWSWSNQTKTSLLNSPLDTTVWSSFSFLQNVLYATTVEQYGTSLVYGHAVWRYDGTSFIRVAILGIASLAVLLSSEGPLLAMSNWNSFYTYNQSAKRVFRWSNDLVDLLSRELTYDIPTGATFRLYDTGEVRVMDGTSVFFQSGTGITDAPNEKTAVNMSPGATYVLSTNGMYLLERSSDGRQWTLGLRILNTPEFAAYCIADDGSSTRLPKTQDRMIARCTQYADDPRCLCMDQNRLMVSAGFETFNDEAKATLRTKVGCIVNSCVHAKNSNLDDYFYKYMKANYDCSSNVITICNTTVSLDGSSEADINIKTACNGEVAGSTGWSTQTIVALVAGIVLLLLVVGYLLYVRRAPVVAKPLAQPL